MTQSYNWLQRSVGRCSLFFALAFLLTLWGCGETVNSAQQHDVFADDDRLVTFLFQGKEATMRMHNFDYLENLTGEERVDMDNPIQRNDSLIVPLSVFDAEFRFFEKDGKLTGNWHNTRKGSMGIVPLHIAHSVPEVWDNASFGEIERYSAVFSADTEDEYPAVAELRFAGEKIKGTIMTETGDYRFLTGTKQADGKFNLHTFDGAHLFHFSGKFDGDKINNGMFYSENTWYEPFTAIQDAGAILAHPDSIVTVTKAALDFHALDLNGDSVHFMSSDMKDQVTIVQVLGTWCPNCLDESRYYKTLFDRHEKDGLKIIPLAFEPHKEFEANKTALTKYQNSLELGYPMYYGGPLSKAKATKVLGSLDQIESFPTSIIVDKQGNIRKVHSGFYGPGTGEYYTAYVKEMDAFIAGLLGE